MSEIPLETSAQVPRPLPAAPAPPIEALETFAAQLSRGSRVLCADRPESHVASWLTTRGIDVESFDPTRDWRFFTAQGQTYAGIWAHAAFGSFPIEDAQRVVASFFKSLRPNGGTFYAAHPYLDTAFASMIRQNGFRILLQGHQSPWTAIVARRI